MAHDFLLLTTSFAPGIKIARLIGAVSTNYMVRSSNRPYSSEEDPDSLGEFGRDLQEACTHAKEALQKQAKELGANAILDFKFNFAEKSSMDVRYNFVIFLFFVFATGTAAVVKYPKKKRISRCDIKTIEGAITLDQILLEEEWIGIIDNIKCKKYLPDVDFVDSIVQEEGLEQDILNSYIYIMTHETDGMERTNAQEFILLYFEQKDPAFVTNLLYRNLNQGRPTVINLIKLCKAFSGKHILDWSGNLRNDHLIALLLCDREVYTWEELDYMKKLLMIADTKEPVRTTVEKKNFLSQSKFITTCQCGEELDRNETYCHKCQRDEFGHTKEENAGIIEFSKKVELIERLLNKTNL